MKKNTRKTEFESAAQILSVQALLETNERERERVKTTTDKVNFQRMLLPE